MSAPPVSRLDRLSAALRVTLLGLRPAPNAGAAFTIDPDDAADDLALVIRARLGPTERAVLALAAAHALGREQAQALGDHLLTATGSGWPGPHPRSLAAEAAAWAEHATRAERLAVVAAVVQRLNERDKAELRGALT